MNIYYDKRRSADKILSTAELTTPAADIYCSYIMYCLICIITDHVILTARIIDPFDQRELKKLTLQADLLPIFWVWLVYVDS
jgi:hypothetical protein